MEANEQVKAEELEAAQPEASENNEFTELEEKDLKAVSGGCGTSTPDPEPTFTCYWCNQPQYYRAKHYAFFEVNWHHEPFCDNCYEQCKKFDWHWSEVTD